MPPVGFEPTISAGERPKTYALDRAATGTGFDPRTVQPVGSRYTDYGTQPTLCQKYDCEFPLLFSTVK